MARRRTKQRQAMTPFICSDPEVSAFIAEEMINFSPYVPAQNRKSARMVFNEARARFGDHRCLDLEFYQH
jgi:hypothetical protein